MSLSGLDGGALVAETANELELRQLVLRRTSEVGEETGVVLTSVDLDGVRVCGCLLYTSPSPRDS